MKKYLLATAGVMVLVIVGLVYMVTKQPDARPASKAKIAGTGERLKRGQYLVKHVVACLGCHSKRDWNRFGAPIVGHLGAGGRCLNERWGMPGQVCAPNLTPDKGSGLASWSDGEILRAIREGVDRHGDALFPFMPYTAYRHLGDEDARAIVAYLRTLKRRSSKVEKSDIDFPVSFFITMVPKPLPGPVKTPKPEVTKSYGEYLATIAGCKACHTPTDAKKRPLSGKDFAGGYEFTAPFGTVYSPNITPHETGIKKWSEATFVQRFHAFRDKKAAIEVEPGKNTPMPWLEYAGMSSDDLKAIYRYLMSIPPVDNQVQVRPGG